MTAKKPEPVEFEMCGYRFLFGPSTRDGETRFSPAVDTMVLWRWNGYFWQVEITDCTDIEGARYSMQYKLAFEREGREMEAKRISQ